ncbi:hypothetical protein V3C99_017420 [Haemonchus contortus]|uniref:Transposase n=1 Tax=Haemonchus contortus TaxID=6289 RepID=A0A7I5EEK6_HAECO
MAVRIDTKAVYSIIISVHAPQAGCPVYEKDEFYLSYDEGIRSFSEEGYFTIACDPDGHLGSERRSSQRIYGGKEVGVRNKGGKRGLDLATSHDLAVCSIFAKRKTHKITYSSGRKNSYSRTREKVFPQDCKGPKVLPGGDPAPQTRSLITIDLHQKSRTGTQRRTRR